MKVNGRVPDQLQLGASRFVRTVCLLGKGSLCCRFLVGDVGGYRCGKLYPPVARQVAIRHMAQAMIARGDNCDGKDIEDLL